MNIFGNLFDFNKDGKLDAFEKSAEFAAFMQMIEAEEKDNQDTDDINLDD